MSLTSFSLVICVIKSFVAQSTLTKAPHMYKIFSFQEILISCMYIAC